MFNDEQKKILSDYTDNLDEVEKITYHEYTKMNSKKVSKLLDDYHVLWFYDDPENMYIVAKKEMKRITSSLLQSTCAP